MKKLVLMFSIIALLVLFQSLSFGEEKTNVDQKANVNQEIIDQETQILRLQLENATLKKELVAKQYVELKCAILMKQFTKLKELEKQLIAKISALSKQKEEQEKDQKLEEPKKSSKGVDNVNDQEEDR